MRYTKWIGLAAALLLIVAAFLPWVTIEDRNLTITGINTQGTNFGKPAYLHFILTAFYIVCVLVPRIWAKRLNLTLSAVNIAWAIRNFFIIPACQGGDCPAKQLGIYLMALASLIMLIAALFPDMKIKEKKK